MTAELKKGKYVYYHCTGKRGGTCKKDYIREEKLNEVFLQLIDKLPNPKEGLFEEIKKAIVEIRKIKTGYEQTSMEEIQKQISKLQKRLDNLYMDKLDGRIKIITPALFYKVQDVFEGKRNPRLQKHDFPYTNLIQCAECGCYLTAEIHKGRLIYYKCTGNRNCPIKTKKYIRQEKIEKAYQDIFDSIQLSEELAEGLILETKNYIKNIILMIVCQLKP